MYLILLKCYICKEEFENGGFIAIESNKLIEAKNIFCSKECLLHEIDRLTKEINSSEFIDPKTTRRKDFLNKQIYGSWEISKGKESVSGLYTRKGKTHHGHL